MTSRRLGIALALAMASSSVASNGLADPSASEKETARALMDQGDKAFDAKDYAAALKAYKAGDAIVGLTTTGIWVAKAEVALGQLVEARDTALTVARIPKKPNESAARGAARKEAEALAEALAARIPSLLVEVDGPADSDVSVDGIAVVAAARGTPQKVNPGKHSVAVTHAGYRDASASVTLKEAENQSIKVKLEPADAPSTKAEAPVAPRDGSEATTEAPQKHPAVYVGFFLGALGIGVGAVTGILALSKASAAKANCSGDICRPAAQDPIDASNAFATASDVGFAAGLIGCGVGVIGLFMSPKKNVTKSATNTGFSWQPAVGPLSLGAKGSF